MRILELGPVSVHENFGYRMYNDISMYRILITLDFFSGGFFFFRFLTIWLNFHRQPSHHRVEP